MSDRWALVPRVSDAVRLDAGDPLVMLFGCGVSDVFVGTDYQERTLDESLWHVLRAAGFRRIVFISANAPVYFLDQESCDFISRRAGGATRGIRGVRRVRTDAGERISHRPPATGVHTESPPPLRPAA